MILVSHVCVRNRMFTLFYFSYAKLALMSFVHQSIFCSRCTKNIVTLIILYLWICKNLLNFVIDDVCYCSTSKMLLCAVEIEEFNVINKKEMSISGHFQITIAISCKECSLIKSFLIVNLLVNFPSHVDNSRD